MKKLYLILLVFLLNSVFALDVYIYKESTGEYKGSKVARRDPLESEKFLIPKNSTIVEPPPVEEYQARIWTGKKWKIVDDYRGFKYWNPDTAQRMKITDINIKPPKNAVYEKPPKNLMIPKYIDGKWIETAKIFDGIVVTNKKEVKDVKNLNLSKELITMFKYLKSVYEKKEAPEDWIKLVKKIEKLEQEEILLILEE